MVACWNDVYSVLSTFIQTLIKSSALAEARIGTLVSILADEGPRTVHSILYSL
jgi:hypothetical protein